MSVSMETTNTLWWSIAHALATISHLLMGIVGIITFHNTAIQALEDFMSGAAVGSSSIRQMGDASLLQGATAVVSQVSSFKLGFPMVVVDGRADQRNE